MALAAAITTGTMLQGVMFMAGIRNGDRAGDADDRASGEAGSGRIAEAAQRILPAFSVVIAVLILLRGLNLGIPYVSPKVVEEPQHERMECCDPE